MASTKRVRIDLTSRMGVDRVSADVSSPPGYTGGKVDDTRRAGAGTQASRNMVSLRAKKSWDIAKQPLQQALLTSFMLYMSGASVNIFSMIITALALWNPLVAIASTGARFESLRESARKDGHAMNLIGPKALYVLLNLALFGVALYKCHSMGLLPTPSDFAANVAPLVHSERVAAVVHIASLGVDV
jgi:ER membrane protein complex subunit 4